MIFLKAGKYKNNNILSDLVKGDYFEACAKFALMKFKLPKNKNSLNVTVEEIVSMDKIIKPDDYILNEEYEEDNDKENNPILINNITDIKGIKNISDTMEENSLDDEVNSKDNKIEDIDDSIEEEIKDIENIGDEDIFMNDETNKEEKIENNEDEYIIISKQNYYLSVLLKEFKVNIKRNEFDSIGLSPEAITYSKNIDDYRLDEIDIQKNNEELIKKNDNYKGDESIFLNQYNKRGKTLDFAYLYGEKEAKTFIGFQMKCYFDGSDLSNDTVDKCKIRKDCQKILINSMKLFNCKITKWCYYLVFYYNRKVQNENINQTNLTKCERNNVCYFFYEPIEKKFYSGNKDVILEMDELELDNDENADLDSCVINAISFSQNIFEEFKIKMGKDIDMKKSFIEDFQEAFQIKEKDIISILYKIKTILKLNNCDVRLHARCKFSNNYFFPPEKDYIFLYKRKGSKSFIASYIKNKENKFFDFSVKKKVETIFDCLAVKSDYYYCLKKIKIYKNKRIPPKKA